MAEVIWAPSALNDVHLIHEFISRDSEARALLFIDRLIEYTTKLKNFPQIGRIIPEIGEENLRKLIYGFYRIMYKLSNDLVWITGIIHSSSNWKP